MNTSSMLVLHANWNQGALLLWAESLQAWLAEPAECSTVADGRSSALLTNGDAAREHPFAVGCTELRDALRACDLLPVNASPGDDSLTLHLPGDGSAPLPSERLEAVLGSVEAVDARRLVACRVPAIALRGADALAVLLRLDEAEAGGASGPMETDGPPASSVSDVITGHVMRYWTALGQFALDLLLDQRFIPTIYQARGRRLQACWQPWLHDHETRTRLSLLLSAMPTIARATEPGGAHPWTIVRDALVSLTDGVVRQSLVRESFLEAIDDHPSNGDPHAAWLAGLLGEENHVEPPDGLGIDLLRDAGRWISRLDETGQDKPLHLALRLSEPDESAFAGDDAVIVAPDDQQMWRLSVHLVCPEHPEALIDADQIWSSTPGGPGTTGLRVEEVQELLLSELGRASRIYPALERALTETAPTGIDLTTAEVYEFLREHRSVLEEAGVEVFPPEWWDDPSTRLGARLQIDAPPIDAPLDGRVDGAAGNGAALGLHSLVRYRWQVAVGDQPLTMEEFEYLAQQSTPLVRVRGRWVELRPEDMTQAGRFLVEQPEGEIPLLEAIQLGFGAGADQPGLPVTGLDASGWVADILHASDRQHMPRIDQPRQFIGTLRPYQKAGLSWLAFLNRFGLGACLADDMGLGKTIQLIALLLHEREHRVEDPALTQVHDAAPDDAPDGQSIGASSAPGPTLLVVPTSVVSNWHRELARFAPSIRAHVHHGPDRPMDEAFEQQAREADVIITTYALVSRDHDTLTRIHWHRVVLDEAQYIKNPPTKQASAIRALKASHRIALTGTPVENRLSELWSIMEFCNPGYLGPANEFRQNFAIPIERHRDQHRAETLRNLIQPFVLRRLKTDPEVISDLPPCVETKEYATLTPEQAALYERTVNRMLGEVDQAEGIQRRGLVLATLVKLKQICNHPAQMLGEPVPERMMNMIDAESLEQIPEDLADASADGTATSPGEEHTPDGRGDGHDERHPQAAALSARSGKARRLLQLLEEVIATGERALIFTQFRRMGQLLTAMLRHELDCEALFLHGGTAPKKRQEMIDRFQSPEGGPPVFVLSLKAGGVGLNLTAANHVFHFDRWWNPAVENQATDRAFRIGQTRTVHVHKFVCAGTLEERIDQMIEQKTELAQHIIGSGEKWLTELSTSQLQDLLELRRNAMEVDA